jgi:very-short-patch-repair endonuclease
MRTENRTVDGTIARIATRQHGVATREQLLAAGVSASAIARRVRRGSLLAEFRGVYRVGHRAPSAHARYTAAVLACGPGALLSGRAAAHLLGLVKAAPRWPEVTASTERRVAGVRTHRCRVPSTGDAASHDGIPVTSAARTLVDLAATLSAESLARACHEAGVRYRTTPGQVEAVLARRPNSRGARKLRRILHGDVRVTLSTLERSFIALLSREGLPLPETNRAVGGRRVDCHWPNRSLTVELDGYRYHRSRHAWEQDRRREREARARGDEFRRYTYGDVIDDPTYLVAELRQLFAGSDPA